MKGSKKPLSPICVCGSGGLFQACCQPLLTGLASAKTAEALMRSRYTAYGLKNEAYLLATWWPETRPECLDLAQDAAIKWVGLKIEWSRVESQQAWVHFIASYKIQGKLERLIETSHFVQQNGVWFYRAADAGVTPV